MKNFRKVAFGLGPDEQIPSDPLNWAQSQITDQHLNLRLKEKFIQKELKNIIISMFIKTEKF